MPDPIIQPSPMDPAAVEDHNKQIAQKVAAQDIMGASMTPGSTEPAQSALDKLFQENEARLKAAAGGKEAPDPNATPATPKTTDEPAPKPAEPVAEPKADETPAPAAEPTPEQKRAEELFKDAPKLPTGASPKSAEAFNHVKVEAAKKMMDLENKLAETSKALEEERKRATTPTTEQLEKENELKELRNWRAKVDVQFDPAFREFDKQISEASEFIYAQLKESPAINDDHINLIKQYGGPHKINLTKLFETIKDPTLQRSIENQVNELKRIEYQKGKKIAEAKDNIETYTQAREEHWKKQATAHTMETQNQLTALFKDKSMEWFAPKKPADSATAEEKKAAEAHNAFISELNDQIKAAANDDSPQMRAVLVAGMAQLFNLQREHASLKAQLESAVKERDALSTKMEKIKASATTRLRESAAPGEGVRQPAKPAVGVKTRTEDAVDALARQVMEERQAKGLPV
jgi:hypothetical protein